MIKKRLTVGLLCIALVSAIALSGCSGSNSGKSVDNKDVSAVANTGSDNKPVSNTISDNADSKSNDNKNTQNVDTNVNPYVEIVSTNVKHDSAGNLYLTYTVKFLTDTKIVALGVANYFYDENDKPLLDGRLQKFNPIEFDSPCKKETTIELKTPIFNQKEKTAKSVVYEVVYQESNNKTKASIWKNPSVN